jgi:signal transduction histidine kinase
MEDINLSGAVTKCTLQLEALALEAGIRLNSDIEEDIYVRGQDQRVRGIVQSLIENAVKYEARGGNIDISLKRYGRKIIFRVRNTTLIGQDDLPHIFDKFYRGASGQKEGGHGLGLSIVKAAVESMGGQIRAVSSERSGTCLRSYSMANRACRRGRLLSPQVPSVVLRAPFRRPLCAPCRHPERPPVVLSRPPVILSAAKDLSVRLYGSRYGNSFAPLALHRDDGRGAS